jgi:uncharacterized delta-60 repeat protein
MRISRRSFALPALLALLLLAPTTASALTQTDLDSSYGNAGIATLATTSNSTPIPAMQSDGKAVLAFETPAGAPTVIRLTASGAIDTSFGTGGSVSLNLFAASDHHISRVLIAADGTIYVVGSGDIASDSRAAIWALTPAGAPKTSFNGTGSILLPIVGSDENETVDAAFTPSGNLAVLSGETVVADSGLLVRIVSPTAAVSAGGSKTFSGSNISPGAITVLPDGSAIVGFSAESSGGILSASIKFTPAGVFDTGYGGGGYAYFGPPVPIFGFVTRAFQAGGQIALLGTIGYNATVGIYSSSGVALPSLGQFMVHRSLPPGAYYAYTSDGGAVASNRLVGVGGAGGGGLLPPYIERLNSDGSPDQSFAPSGIAYLPLPSVNPRFALQPDGKYLVVAYNSTDQIVVARIWGDSPAPQSATVAFASSIKSKIRASKAKKFTGTTGGTGVTKVELAIQKVDSKLLKKSKKCTYIKSTKTTTKNYKAVGGKCVPGAWLSAKGTTSWSVKLSKALKPGKYVLSARSTGFLGFSTVVTKSVTLQKG